MEIKVKVVYTDGYEKRFTQACLDILKKRQEKERAEKVAAEHK